MDDYRLSTRRLLARLNAAPGLVIVCYALTLLVLMPFYPGMPGTNADSSWQYAMNVAVTRHLRFGTDLIFTFGPLASAYTHQYSPGTDAMMLVASFILSTAVFAGFAVHAWRSRAAWLVAVPFVLSLIARDTLFMALPLLLVLASELRSSDRWHRLVLCTLAAASGLLPLIKVSVTVVATLGMLLAMLALWSRSRIEALLLPGIAIATLVSGWLLCGQALGDLPRYFISQQPIVAGYTEAMSTRGPAEDLLAYLGAALIAWCALWKVAPFSNWRVMLATTAILFLSFKAGFVRHDAHAVIAASALLLIGFLVVFLSPSRTAFVTLAVSLCGWSAIAGTYERTGPLEVVSRYTGSLSTGLDGLQIRIFHGEWLGDWFRIANDGIARRQPLPVRAGTADLYLAELSVLLANGATWLPRPIPQSYSAYTPELAALNAQHVRTSGADRVYFGPGSVDGHYPSLDDGSSWPALLAMYEPSGFAGRYAVLDRRPSPGKVEKGPLLVDRRVPLGVDVPVPAAAAVWAQVDIRPTFLGKLVSLVFKPPALSISFRARDGRTKAYRFIPAFGSSGFLLSPTVSDAREFVALQSTRSQELLAGNRPASFRVAGESGSTLLWESAYSLRISELRIDSSAAADRWIAQKAQP